jgi:hypothetical protein
MVADLHHFDEQDADPHHTEKSDPDPYYSENSDPDLHPHPCVADLQHWLK